MLTGHLQLLVLKALSKQNLSGYALIKQIEQQTGFWKPSPGSIFPLLQKLEHEGHISTAKEKRKNTYSITPKGKAHVKAMVHKKHELVCRMEEMLKVHQALAYDKDDAHFFSMILEQIKKGEIPFKELQPEIGMVRGTIFQLYASSCVKGNEKAIKHILQQTIKKLRSLKRS